MVRKQISRLWQHRGAAEVRGEYGGGLGGERNWGALYKIPKESIKKCLKKKKMTRPN